MVDRLPIGPTPGPVSGLARFQLTPEQRTHKGRKAFARYPHDAHAAAAGGRGNRSNGISVMREHEKRW